MALAVGTVSWKVGVWLLAPRNLLEGVPWTASSEALKCNPAMHTCGGTRTDIFFHTNAESNPWLRYDLGSPKSFSSVTVRNRQDMGLERCLPLIVETSDDGESWTERVQRTERFVEWRGEFPAVTARFVRLRVASPLTWFHLEAVELHP
ncbi:MAG: discoidin domain-containing protein [Myxococcaceae bacterium]|nr:discoidin domain-containing protein [Myxococcaceae bacterium]